MSPAQGPPGAGTSCCFSVCGLCKLKRTGSFFTGKPANLDCPGLTRWKGRGEGRREEGPQAPPLATPPLGQPWVLLSGPAYPPGLHPAPWHLTTPLWGHCAPALTPGDTRARGARLSPGPEQPSGGPALGAKRIGLSPFFLDTLWKFASTKWKGFFTTHLHAHCR